MNYDSPSDIKRVLEEHGLALKKRFGQNFLVNPSAREKIIACLDPSPADTVWEMGPGLGAMTGLLLARAARVVVFEIDRGFVKILKGFFGDRPGFFMEEGDALKNLETALREYGPPDRLLGNLPYSSASQILAAFIEREIAPRRLTVTVQKELALRLRAAPGQKIYSSFSVLCQSFFNIRHEFDLKGGSFHPRPDVDSSVVTLEPDFRPAPGPAREAFFRLIRLSFSSRRKTLSNNLFRGDALTGDEKDILRDFLMKAGVDANARAEELTPEMFRRAAAALAAGSADA